MSPLWASVVLDIHGDSKEVLFSSEILSYLLQVGVSLYLLDPVPYVTTFSPRGGLEATALQAPFTL